MNLFETIDGFFRGVVHFFYNLVETIFSMARRPLAGPLWLHKRHQNKRVDQIGGATFLFMVYFVSYSLYFRFILPSPEEGEQQSQISRHIADVIASGDGFSWDFFWPIIMATFVSTILVDAVFRLATSMITRRNTRRRRMLNDSFKFALVWPICFLLLAYPFWQVQSEGAFSIRSPGDWRSASVIAAILVLSYPAVRIFLMALPRLTAWMRLVVGLLAAIAIFASIYGSSLVAISLAAVPLDREDTAALGLLTLHVDQIRCTYQEDRRLFLYAVVSNRGREPAMISPGDLSVGVAPGGQRHQLVRPSGAEESAELLAPGASLAITRFAVGVPAPPGLQTQYCSLIGFNGMNVYHGEAAPIYPEVREVEEHRRTETRAPRP